MDTWRTYSHWWGSYDLLVLAVLWRNSCLVWGVIRGVIPGSVTTFLETLQSMLLHCQNTSWACSRPVLSKHKDYSVSELSCALPSVGRCKYLQISPVPAWSADHCSGSTLIVNYHTSEWFTSLSDSLVIHFRICFSLLFMNAFANSATWLSEKVSVGTWLLRKVITESPTTARYFSL